MPTHRPDTRLLTPSQERKLPNMTNKKHSSEAPRILRVTNSESEQKSHYCNFHRDEKLSFFCCRVGSDTPHHAQVAECFVFTFVCFIFGLWLCRVCNETPETHSNVFQSTCVFCASYVPRLGLLNTVLSDKEHGKNLDIFLHKKSNVGNQILRQYQAANPTYTFENCESRVSHSN